MLLLAPPAGAKGVDVKTVTLGGPGIDRPLTLTWEEFDAAAGNTHPAPAYVGTMISWTRKEPLPATTHLGPSYVLTFRIESLRRGDSSAVFSDTISQTLYPFAEGGAIAVTPPRQTVHVPFSRAVRKVPAGSQTFPQPLLEVLREHGLPTQPPPPEVPDEIPATDRPLAPWFKLAVVLVVFAIAAAIIRRRTLSQS